jgi:sarcosine oxidase subunit alpha
MSKKINKNLTSNFSLFTSPDICVIGGGPAGLEAAIVAKELGADVIIADDNPVLGGQLIKQTHKFFGSQAHYCGVRGFNIGEILSDKVKELGIKILLNATVVGYYDDDSLGVLKEDASRLSTNGRDELFQLKAKRYIFATGASENMLAYQLLQAGAQVAAIVEILDKIGGYYVHAAKIKRAGVPIYLQHTIIEAKGKESVEAAVVSKVGNKFECLNGTKQTIECDMILIAIGLSPLCELLYHAGCRIDYIPELGGHVPHHNENMRTSKSHIFVCGDLACIEEASTAMLEGKIAGAKAYESLYGKSKAAEEIARQAKKELSIIRTSPFEERIVFGKGKLMSN